MDSFRFKLSNPESLGHDFEYLATKVTPGRYKVSWTDKGVLQAEDFGLFEVRDSIKDGTWVIVE